VKRWCAALVGTFLGGLGCHTLPAAEPAARRAPTYRPGQSIAESRVCECRECFQPRCCGGESEAETASNEEFGMTLGSCSRCVRRVWTVRGDVPCDTLAPPECCPGSASS
jgi:hypothetical protein